MAQERIDMAFGKQDVEQLQSMFDWHRESIMAQLRNLLDRQRSDISVDTRSVVTQELRPIQADIEYVKKRLDSLFEMKSEDIEAAYREIEVLKKQR